MMVTAASHSPDTDPGHQVSDVHNATNQGERAAPAPEDSDYAAARCRRHRTHAAGLPVPALICIGAQGRRYWLRYISRGCAGRAVRQKSASRETNVLVQ